MGNKVKSQSWESAVFLDLGSSPSPTEVGRLVDALGRRLDYDIHQPDAAQALCTGEDSGPPHVGAFATNE